MIKAQTIIIAACIKAGLIIGFVIGAIFGSYKYGCDPNVTPPNHTEELPIVTSAIDTLTSDAVYHYCLDNGVAYPAIVTAQSIQESGWKYESYNVSERNNVLGLRGHNYLKFDNWRESVDCYRDKIQSRYTGGDYYQFLERIGYASDSSYCDKVRAIVTKLIEL